MTTTATHNEPGTTPARVLFMAFALREKTWQLGFTTGPGQKPRERGVAARNQARMLQEVAPAKQRFGVPAKAPVVSGDDAGRAGFWLHRFLQAPGLTSQVVDASSMAIKRCQRRVKSEGLDIRQLLRLLRRFHHGAREGWRVVQGPAVAAEDPRHLHRALASLKQARARTTTRIKGLRRSQGIRLRSLNKWPEPLDALRRWDGSPMPSGRRHRLRRVDAHRQFVRQQLAALEAERCALLETSQETSLEKLRQLLHRQGIGIKGACLLVLACLGWHDCKNRREVGG
jgi:transposase